MANAYWKRKRRKKSKLTIKRERFLEKERNPKHPLDIFEQRFRVPENIIIAAPGYGADVGFDYVTSDDYIIAPNRGVRMPIDHVNVWVLADKNAPNAFWWPDPTPDGCLHIFDDGFLRKYIDKTPGCPHQYDYLFRTGWRLEEIDWVLRYGVLRGGCTASIQALQMAYFCGAKNIRLLGVRFEGNKYWDGRETGAMSKRAGRWPVVSRVNKLIRWMQSKGVVITTMSDTALDIPVWKGVADVKA